MLGDSLSVTSLSSERPLDIASAVARLVEAFLSLRWIAEGGEPAACRYAAHLGSQLLVGSLASLTKSRARSDPDAGEKTHTLLIKELAEEIVRLLFLQIGRRGPIPTGLYRAEWSSYLPYEMAYFSRQVETAEFRTLMSDELRRLILGLGGSHLRAYHLLGLPVEASALDDALADGADGGAASILEATGDSERWLSDERQLFSALKQGLSKDWFTTLWQPLERSKDEELCPLLYVLLHGASAATDGWRATVASLLDPGFRPHVQQSPRLLDLVMVTVALAALAHPEERGFLRWLTPAPTRTRGNVLEGRTQAVVYLLCANSQAEQRSPAIEKRILGWIQQVLMSRAQAVELKRRLLHQLGEARPHMGEALHKRLRTVMERVRENPQMAVWPEWEHYGFVEITEGEPDAEE